MTTNTARSFFDKWTQNPQMAFAETLREGSAVQEWILSRNGFASGSALRDYLKPCARVLDAGCGNGRVTALLRALAPANCEVVGFDLVAAEVARENLGDAANVHIESGDLLGDLSRFGLFDFVYCQEVLHHTGNPRAAFLNLATRVRPGGELAVYVYRRKAPIREFTDDYVRAHIGAMPYLEARTVSAQITELGRALADVRVRGEPVQLAVPAVPLLGIDAGTYDLQRFIYHFFMKCFWSPELSHDDNVAVNYDWYHPQDATRHELDEVLGWFGDAHLRVVHSLIDPYGITVRGQRAA
jgi:SAM-dependent methyltransferase